MEIELTPSGRMIKFEPKSSVDEIYRLLLNNEADGLSIQDNYVDGIYVKDISFLKLLPKLKSLRINCFKLKDYTPLSTLVNLEDLTLQNSSNQIIDFKNLMGLKKLYIDHSTNYFGLENCINLEYLRIHSTNFENFNLFLNLRRLKTLVIYENKPAHVTSLKGIQNLQHLEVLKLNCSKIKSIMPLNGLMKLKALQLDSMKKIEDIHLLNNLPSLERIELLELGNIESIKFMENFSKLNFVFIPMGTLIEDGNLTYLKNVKKVDIPWRPSHYYSNRISKWLKRYFN